MADPRLDCLPMELFLMVFEEGCNKTDIANLVLCNKRLQMRLEPVLYDTTDALSKAMKWACLKGNIETIHKSSKKQQEKTIRLLVDLGVRLLSPDMDKKRRLRGIKEFRYCANHLCSSRLSHEQSATLLWFLYEKAIDEQGRKKWDADTALPLITLIRSPAGVSLDLMRQVLDDGADPNKPRSFKHRYSLCPLSAAIIANSEPAFHLLLERGASIHGAPVKSWARIGLHIPIFAAAMTLAVADHGKTMMQLCLDNGVDINHERISAEYTSARYKGPGSYVDSGKYTNTTPLLHATEWEAPVVENRPSTGVGTSIAAVDAVLGKWGLATFREPGFAEIIKILLSHQIFDRCPLHTYLGDWARYYENVYPRNKEVEQGLATLTTILLENMQFNIRGLLPFEDVDEVLANFICDKPSTNVWYPYYIITETLLQAGANINAANAVYNIERGMVSSYFLDNAENSIYNCDRYELPALHLLCNDLRSTIQLHGEVDGHGWVELSDFYEDNVYEHWIPRLIKYGADPTIPASDKRKTALDLLVAGDIDNYLDDRSTVEKESIENYLQSLAIRWRKIHEERLACGKGPVMSFIQSKAMT